MVISFENVTYIKNIKTKEETKVLDNVSFHIEESTITSILGDSKSGIEYLSLLINKSITPTYGRVKTLNFINERKRINNINRLKSKVGLILTNPKDMLFNKTVKEELAFSLKHFKYKNNENRLSSSLKLVGLDETYLNKEIKDLSLNEQKKVSIASALIYNPSIILLNNITYGLNTKEKEDIKKLLIKLKEKYKKTIILFTKDTDFVYGLSDYIHIFKDGKLFISGKNNLLEKEDILKQTNLKIPDLVKFISIANKKNANITYTSNILDLIKEVYRSVH